jgi:hypothetical protein
MSSSESFVSQRKTVSYCLIMSTKSGNNNLDFRPQTLKKVQFILFLTILDWFDALS